MPDAPTVPPGNRTLEAEIKYYEEHRPEFLLNYRDRFLLIKGMKLEGVYCTFQEALTEGARKFGFGPFLIKQVVDPEPQAFFLNGNAR